MDSALAPDAGTAAANEREDQIASGQSRVRARSVLHVIDHDACLNEAAGPLTVGSVDPSYNAVENTEMAAINSSIEWPR